MSNSEKLIKLLSSFVENGILSSQDLKKEILTSIKFKKDDLIDKFDLVSREEFEILKKIVIRQENLIKKLKKNKKLKR
ncbi:accessory factor UbiK family protein [Pelagibacteraceae bacterium]|jgi:BMFP domain-containing protein YqiC|nr:accessory factor UbiK family protein [Pelagibacteraceae bacterium]|tara:strand:- start:6724 stop:6957 length:234 start_codon:yes stop_codon:yes gene_type:complete